MPNSESSAESALLIVHYGGTSHVVEPGRGPVTIGREPQAGVQIDDPQISQRHLRVEPTDGVWRIINDSPEGMFVDGQRLKSVTVADKTMVRFGDPTAGSALTFEIVNPPKPDEHASGKSHSEQTNSQANELDPGVVRAGAAVAARRRELGISQRSLAADGIINAGALIAFEKGRSWPRERTQAKLEELLQWRAGSIAGIRRGRTTAGEAPDEPAGQGTREAAPDASSDAPASLIAQAIVTAVDGCDLAIAALPPADDPAYNERVTPILADLRKLEAIAVRATHISRITPDLIKALGTVRRHYDELMTLGATAPVAPLARRLYAARRRANLSTSETAQAAGVTEDSIERVEADEEVSESAAAAIEELIRQINF